MVEGSGRIYVQYGWRARPAAVIGGDDDAVLVAVVGWRWGCFVSVPVGHAADAD